MQGIIRTTPALMLMLFSLIVASQATGAEAPPDYLALMSADSVIGAHALEGVHGRSAVNEAAGDSNIQSNNAALALGAGVSAARIHTLETIRAARSQPAGMANVSIAAGAFNNARGLIAVNQTSGRANVQSNQTTLVRGQGIELVTDSMLAAASSSAEPTGGGAHGNKAHSKYGVNVSDGAFKNARGVVQINQSAGSGNATANNFALSIKTGAGH